MPRERNEELSEEEPSGDSLGSSVQDSRGLGEGSLSGSFIAPEGSVSVYGTEEEESIDDDESSVEQPRTKRLKRKRDISSSSSAVQPPPYEFSRAPSVVSDSSSDAQGDNVTLREAKEAFKIMEQELKPFQLSIEIDGHISLLARFFSQ